METRRVFRRQASLFHGFYSARTRYIETDLKHGLLERFAILALWMASGLAPIISTLKRFKIPAL